jgi:cell division protein FtsB
LIGRRRRRRIRDLAELRDVFLTSLTLGKNYMEFVCKMESHIIALDTQVKKLKKKKHSWGV